MHTIRSRSPAKLAFRMAAALGLAWFPGLPVSDAGQAFAQAPASVTVTDVGFEMGSTRYRIPRLEIRGGNLSESDAKALFDKTSSLTFEQRLSKLTAQEIVVPSMVVEQAVGEQRQTTTYRDLSLTGIAQGRIASVSGAAGAFDMTGPDKAPKGTFGRISMAELDVAQMLLVYGAKAGTDGSEFRNLYRSFSMDDINVLAPTGGHVRIGRIAAGTLKARPTAQSWSGTIAALGELGGKGPQSEAQQSRMMSLSAELLDAFDLASMDLVDMEMQPPDGAKEPRIRVARIAYAGASSGRSPEMRLDGFDAQAPEGSVRIASIAFADFSFHSTLAGMKSLDGKPLAGIAPAELRKYLPNFGTVRLAGIEVDVPTEPEDGSPPGAKPGRTRFGLRSFDLAADKPINGVPTGLKMSISNLSMPIDPKEKQEGLSQLAAMGFRALDLSSAFAASWTEATSELSVREFSLKGANLGSVLVRGTFGNVGRDVFDADTAVASVALVGATIKNLDILIENSGLGDKLIAQQAAEQKRSAEDLRREYGMTAAVGIPAVLGNSAQAKALGSAVARFIARPNRLAISARVKDGVGLGAADFGLIGDPNGLMTRLDITATAE